MLIRHLSTCLVAALLAAAPALASPYGKGPKPASSNAPGEPSCQAGKCPTQYEIMMDDWASTPPPID